MYKLTRLDSDHADNLLTSQSNVTMQCLTFVTNFIMALELAILTVI